MKLDCASVSDAIWASIREGTRLGDDILQHIESCSSCADTKAEAAAGLSALGRIAPHPAAPDCRSAVWASVSRHPVRRGRIWAYACTVLLIALAIAGGLLWPTSDRPVPRQATSPPTARRLLPQPPAMPPKSQPEVRVAGSDRPQAPRHITMHKLDFRHHRSESMRHLPSANTAFKPAGEIKRPEVTPPAEDSSALAYVTWQIATQPQDSYQDSYTETDPATGEVTRCSVKRKGNAVDIEMESEPVEPVTKPIKESNSNETILCG